VLKLNTSLPLGLSGCASQSSEPELFINRLEKEEIECTKEFPKSRLWLLPFFKGESIFQFEEFFPARVETHPLDA
jgi:hypothetical protein